MDVRRDGTANKIRRSQIEIIKFLAMPFLAFVARHGRLPMWFRQQFRQTRIEIVVFWVMPQSGICRAWWMLCAWYLEQSPGSRVEIIMFLIIQRNREKKERVRCLIFPAPFLCVAIFSRCIRLLYILRFLRLLTFHQNIRLSN